MEDQKHLEAIIMTALSTLTPLQLTNLTHYSSSLYHHYHRRIFSLLSSPTLFSLTLHYLNSLSLHQKFVLIARHLLSKLAILVYFMQKKTILPPPSTTSMNLRDLDAVLLLLLLCELRQHEPGALDAPPSRWRDILGDYIAKDMLKLSSIESSKSEVIIKFVELVTKCKNFVNVMAYDVGELGRSSRILDSATGGEGKDSKNLAASVAVVAALPSVEVMSGSERECVICKEEMREGKDVCKLPCDHIFHWKCILPWLKKMNTCPCCRFQLPSDDVLAEIQRLWEILAKMSGAA
ncbi:E3 ubiquitin-protein ligase SGR9, amyloplastic isoform X1 [Nicotiana tabacum]|uniref:RING-type E3 ubiquitin transferase n=1 Tax=Nicotiana tabacum TaxID=4097 RepID=A0A1S4D4F2_TOBAC|nr:PREDICTED: E3 ubiquitin-protein ligase SGR9, amyloplastic-like isoform X1 [Nicotiana tabacum]